MSVSDHAHVNFSQDHELNYRLTKVGKRQTQKNREALVAMGAELKQQLDKTILLHKEFHPYVEQQKARLE